MDIASKYRRGLSAVGLQIKGSADELDSTSPTLTSGAGAPTAVEPTNSIYIRNNASDSDTLLYRSTDGAGTWEAVVGSEVTDLLGAANDWTGANTFSDASGVTTDVITEATPAAGITADGVLLQDGGIICADGASIEADVVNEATSGAGVTIDGLLVRDAGIEASAGFRLDSQGVTHAINLDLGTDTSATQLRVRNNSLGTLFEVNGAGDASLAGYLNTDQLVVAVVAAAGGTGGATAGTLEVDLYRADETTVLQRPVQAVIIATSAQYEPSGPVVTTVTFSAATKGTIVASGSGWCLFESDADGEFDCTVSDSADESIYLFCRSADKVSDLTDTCRVMGCVPASATWSA